jgi:hypothetical protein
MFAKKLKLHPACDDVRDDSQEETKGGDGGSKRANLKV